MNLRKDQDHVNTQLVSRKNLGNDKHIVRKSSAVGSGNELFSDVVISDVGLVSEHGQKMPFHLRGLSIP